MDYILNMIRLTYRMSYRVIFHFPLRIDRWSKAARVILWGELK